MAKKKMYDDYLKRLSDRIEAELSAISTGYNFDYGDEFEIAICKILTMVLPDKYAVCRGYVVTANGDFAGDDIIIYDKFHLPTLRPSGEERFSQKQKIPIESVYAYIEAKHGLVVKGTGNGSLTKAIDQVGKVKALINSRKPVSLNTINRYIKLPFSPEKREGSPDRRNPSYAIILARNVKITQSDLPTEDANEILTAMLDVDLDIQTDIAPDLIVLGQSCLMHPFSGTEEKPKCRSPFYSRTQSQYLTQAPIGRAFGVSLLFLMTALEYMEVGGINWTELVLDAFQTET